MSAGSNIVRYWKGDFEWVTVSAGEFIYGQENETQMINYDYDAMIYEVTNVQFVEFLREYEDQLYFQNDGTDCQFEYIYGNYSLEGYFTDNLYHFISLADSRIIYSYPANELGECYGSGDFSIEGGYEDHPVTGVTWFGAQVFSESNGFRLPTDPEWEKAARGTNSNNYPWGQPPENLTDILTSTKANYRESGDDWDDGTTPVGFYNGINDGNDDSYSPFGLYDMCGNVREWTSTLDIQGNDILPISRGGHFLTAQNSDLLKVWSKDPLHPLVDSQNPGSNDTGFRCVKD